MQWTTILEATTGWGERTCTPVYTFSRPTLDLKPEQVGLTLAEAKTLLARLQEQLIRQQADEYATCRRVYPRCYRMQPVKDYKYRPESGSIDLRSPSWREPTQVDLGPEGLAGVVKVGTKPVGVRLQALEHGGRKAGV